MGLEFIFEWVDLWGDKWPTYMADKMVEVGCKGDYIDNVNTYFESLNGQFTSLWVLLLEEIERSNHSIFMGLIGLTTSTTVILVAVERS